MQREQGVVEVYASPAAADQRLDRAQHRRRGAQSYDDGGRGGANIDHAVDHQRLRLATGYAADRAMRSACARGEQAAQGSTAEIDRAVRGRADNSGGFDWMAYMAPSMAVLFLMFTVSLGGRSVLAERQWGTLQRLLTSPTSPAQVLGGKISGIFLTGLAQMVILIVFSALVFGVRWGAPVALIVLIVATVFAATGWGALIAAYAKSPGQAMSIGSMMALVFAGLAGNFVPRQNYPEWLQTDQPCHAECVGAGRISVVGARAVALQAVLLPIVP